MNNILKHEELIGKTISSFLKKKLIGYDDTGFFEIKFTDGTKIIIKAYYWGYTGDSQDEYPTCICLTDAYEGKLEDIKSQDLEVM